MTTPKRPAFRASLADQRRANLAHLKGMALLHGVTDEGQRTIDELAGKVKPKVSRPASERKPRTADMGKPESEVQKECIAYLCQHPRVHMVVRINSGAIQSDKYYVEFNRIYLPAKYRVTFPENPKKMRISDVLILMDDARLFAMEAKPETWTRSHGTSDKAIREQEQDNFLAHVRMCGGLAIFATSTEDVKAALIVGGYL